MHFKTFFSLILFITFSDIIQAQDHFKVCFFLLEECKITQAYIPEINSIHKDFSNDRFEYHAYFSSPASDRNDAQRFADRYNLTIPIEMDSTQFWAKKFDITVMPEVVVYNINLDQIVYQGRIDNLFAKIGKRRSRATQTDLRDALNSILKGIPIAVPKTTAVGCFLEKM